MGSTCVSGAFKIRTSYIQVLFKPTSDEITAILIIHCHSNFYIYLFIIKGGNLINMSSSYTQFVVKNSLFVRQTGYLSRFSLIGNILHISRKQGLKFSCSPHDSFLISFSLSIKPYMAPSSGSCSRVIGRPLRIFKASIPF